MNKKKDAKNKQKDPVPSDEPVIDASSAETEVATESPAEDPASTELPSLEEFFDEPASANLAEVSEEETAEPRVPLRHIVEAILFATQKPVSAKELVSILKGAAEADKENPDSPALPFARIKPDALRQAVEELKIACLEPSSTYEVRENAAGWQLVTKADFSPWLRQLFPENRSARISAPAMETLAIIAYRQPITRADLEAVRGVAVDGVMQTLLDRSLIKIAGRAEVPGRPLLYETTQYFMEHFGLTNLDDLPNATELRKINLPKAPIPEEPAAPEAKAAETPAEESLPQEPGPESGEAPAESTAEQIAPETPAEEPAVALEESEPVSEAESSAGEVSDQSEPPKNP